MGRLPSRPISRPVTVAKPNMPNVCAVITSEISPVVWLCSCICTGVMTIIITMTNWLMTIDATANCTMGSAKMADAGRLAAVGWSSTWRALSRARLNCLGSGRSRAKVSTPANSASSAPNQ